MVDGELVELREEFVPPHGRFYLVLWTPDEGGAGRVAACGGIRRMDDGVCQLMRIFVRPELRGRGIARAIVERLMADARKIGYSAMQAEVLPTMLPALALLRGLGFADQAPWRDLPPEWGEWVFLRTAL